MIMRRVAAAAFAALLLGCQPKVTEVELTPGPVTDALTANFLGEDEGAALANRFQLRDGHVDIRVIDGRVYALTTLDDDDVATAEKICDAIRRAADGPNIATDIGTINVIAASDLTVKVCKK